MARDRMQAEEANDLLERFRTSGDTTLRNEVVEAHVPLARHIARDYADRGIDHDDLVQVGTVGLVKAADRFDPDLGVPFSAYASRVVNGEIKRWFRDKGWNIRPPRSLIELGTRLKSARTELAQELQRTPTVDELARALDVDPDDVLAAMEAMSAYAAEPIVRPGQDGGTYETAAVGAEDADLRRAEAKTAVEQLLDTLDEDDRRIVHLRFWEEKSQQEIADEVGVSQMQVSRLLRRILRRLRTTGEPDAG